MISEGKMEIGIEKIIDILLRTKPSLKSFDRNELKNLAFEKLQLDSLDVMTFSLDLEEEFGISVALDEFLVAFSSIASLEKFVQEKQQKRQS